MNSAPPFTQIEDNFGYGSNPPSGWIYLPQTAPLILVGVTGVGKSRTVEELIAQGLALTVLPNRRLLTDKLIIDKLQRLDGVAANEDGSSPRFVIARSASPTRGAIGNSISGGWPTHLAGCGSHRQLRNGHCSLTACAGLMK